MPKIPSPSALRRPRVCCAVQSAIVTPVPLEVNVRALPRVCPNATANTPTGAYLPFGQGWAIRRRYREIFNQYIRKNMSEGLSQRRCFAEKSCSSSCRHCVRTACYLCKPDFVAFLG